MLNLVIHDTLATTVFAEPLRRAWVMTDFEVTLEALPNASSIAPDEFALLPSPECTLLADTHAIVSDVAVIAQETGAIAMRSPVRPDELESTNVLLYESSATAHVLARALLWPFFGITVSDWVTEPEPDVLVTIVEGALALQSPESGFSEDLVRSWFVLTGMPVVTHVLLAPVETNQGAVDRVLMLLGECRQVAHDRRRELRQLIDEEHGLERERLVGFLGQQRYQLEPDDREALVALLVKGTGGSGYLPLTRLPFREETETEHL